MDDFNLYPLFVFQQVARRNSVTQAAGELNISQPAVSAQLKALEARYGAQLLERTPRGVRLTPAGNVLLDHAHRVFALLEDARAAVASANNEVRGEVHIAASSTPGIYWLPEALRRFRDTFPAVEPVFSLGDSAQVRRWLLEYRVPMGIVGEGGNVEGLAQEPVGTDELRLVTAANDPLSEGEEVDLALLRERTLLLREPGSSTRAGAETLLGALLQHFHREVEMDSAEAIKRAVAAGLGVSVLSSWATRLEEAAGLLRPVRDARFRLSRQFYLIRRSDRQLVGAAAALWTFLREGAHESQAGVHQGEAE